MASEFNMVDYRVQLGDDDFQRIRTFMLENLGIKMDLSKQVMVNSRLLKRLRATQITNFTDYLNYTFSDKGKMEGELQKLIDELTTHKTDFFRENEHFNLLKNEILPQFVNEKKGRPIKIWSAGCSTGEESYTISMILNDYKILNGSFNFEIYASDVSEGSLIKAVRAVYKEQDIENMDRKYVKRYFLKSKKQNENLVRMIKQIRDSVHFFQFNLMDQISFQDESLDAIFCRNTLIYFKEENKSKVVNKLIEKIKVGGYLFVGMSETVSLYSSRIKQVKPSAYQKIK